MVGALHEEQETKGATKLVPSSEGKLEIGAFARSRSWLRLRSVRPRDALHFGMNFPIPLPRRSLLLALPLVALYEGSVWSVRMVERRLAAERAAAAATKPAE